MENYPLSLHRFVKRVFLFYGKKNDKKNTDTIFVDK